ncbi:3-phosphoshikimate 1-carboxyvinyltransferase [Rhodopirellula sp. MGV]|uniref:3-phosphoshikimate 1-carboxyvinyltransferase n=1 Tax=Rhodopirellula sp. MGV TaxID=2023130 RepID=UPI000B968866|nr:3-phosphoshikimate 1-carboxyvinyltransferase [Rhodopirellula sp. MGV]OYP35166.1 3-phosphoshikimate 1-carboxyvinyltransferase [Rhodopirellula sp. MGV]PNY37819.1 3-phosphoshikimate 1-carboxyvinyltransferase [Rhodopirellula baltica]
MSSPTSVDPPASVTVIPGGPVRGSIRPPGSKSLTNRALICAAMAKGSSKLTGCLRSEDTAVMIDSLQKCGVKIEVDGDTLHVDGSQRFAPRETVELFIANSGTSVRFLTAALSAAGGMYRLSGVPRMHERPIADLVDALTEVQNGAIRCESDGGCPPVMIESNGWNDALITVAGNVSSQYLSGLMMAAPIAIGDAIDSVTIRVTGELVSRPYVDMTAETMRSFGAVVDIEDIQDNGESTVNVVVRQNGYQGVDYAIEPDASAASYFWAAAAITGGEVTVKGLTPDAMQGDVGFCNVLEQMGCTFTHDDDSMTISGRASRGVDVDMNHISDTVQTLSIVALFADGPTRVRGVAHNRFKETDRIGDLACELRKLGATVEEHEDGMTITPPANGVQPATLETYHDHRMAMSLALAGLSAEGVQILDPSCTVKTYPEFFKDLEELLGRPHQWADSAVE